MSREDSPDDFEYDSMEEFLDQQDPALPEPSDEKLREAWDDADPEEHLPTIPETATIDVVDGRTCLWDKTCNRGLKFDGELMEMEDAERRKAKA